MEFEVEVGGKETHPINDVSTMTKMSQISSALSVSESEVPPTVAADDEVELL